MRKINAYDITNYKIGDRLPFNFYGEFSICPDCKRVGLFCEDTDCFYHVILLFEEDDKQYGPPWIAERCDLKDHSLSINDLAMKLTSHIPHPYEKKHPEILSAFDDMIDEQKFLGFCFKVMA